MTLKKWLRDNEIEWQNEQVTMALNDRMTKWQWHWMARWPCDKTIEWQDDHVTKQLNDKMTMWKNNWMARWPCDQTIKWQNDQVTMELNEKNDKAIGMTQIGKTLKCQNDQ